MIPAPLPETPGQVRADAVEVEAAFQERQKLEATGRTVWPMHSRKCRRRMLKLKIQPEQLQVHMAACMCGWPAANLARWQRETVERMKAAEQAMLDKHVEDCGTVIDGSPCTCGADD